MYKIFFINNKIQTVIFKNKPDILMELDKGLISSITRMSETLSTV